LSRKEKEESRVIASDVRFLRKTTKYTVFENKTNYDTLKMWMNSTKT
jgi:hypothetical protein